MNLLDLPNEVLVPILAYAGAQDISSLSNAASVCRTLHDLLQESDAVWREVHALLYDDPSNARAFLSRRSESQFDWRQRVIDRAFAIDFLKTHTLLGADRIDVIETYPWPGADYYPEEEDLPDLSHLIKHAARIRRTVLDMCLDLPRLGAMSRNAPLLETIVNSETFSFLCDYAADDYGRHIQALFLHFKRMHITSDRWWLFSNYHRGGYRSIAIPPERPPPSLDKTDWYGLQVDLHYIYNMDGVGFNLPRDLLARFFEGGMSAVRGHGLVGLDGDGDWARITGTWHFMRSRPRSVTWGLERGELRSQELQFANAVRFEVTPASGIEDLNSQCERIHGGAGCDPRLLEPVLENGLSPVYFLGNGDNAHMIGVVCLTRDEPPEVRWHALVCPKRTVTSDPDDCEPFVLRGTHIGGPGAPRGVVGQFKLVKHLQPVDESAHWDTSDGLIWFVHDEDRLAPEDRGEVRMLFHDYRRPQSFSASSAHTLSP